MTMIVRVKIPRLDHVQDRDAKSAMIGILKGPARRRHLHKVLGALSTERGELEIEVETE
jgi:hypothetical protein